MVGGAVRAAGGGGSRSGIIEGATALLGSLRGHASKTPSRPKIRRYSNGYLSFAVLLLLSIYKIRIVVLGKRKKEKNLPSFTCHARNVIYYYANRSIERIIIFFFFNSRESIANRFVYQRLPFDAR